MKRDMELIRQIVIDIADSDEKLKISHWIDSNKDADRTKVGYHLWLLNDADYLQANFLGTDNDPYSFVDIGNLTWEGQELADSLRSPEIWIRVKNGLTALGGSAAISIVKELATNAALSLLHL